IVSEWRKAWRRGGRAALRSAGHVGRPRKLTQAQLARVERALARGAEANGYATDVWTLPRVAEVIQRLTGVSYHPGHVRYLLRHHFAWKRLSIAAALVYEPDGSDAHLVFQLRPGAYNGESLIEFLTELHQHEQQRVVLLIWDGLPAHRSRCMMDWIASQPSW